MPLSEIVERAARQLDQAANRLERGMTQFGGAAGRVGGTAAGMPAWSARFNAAEAARAAQMPALHAQRAAEQAARRVGGVGAGIVSGAAEALVGHALRGMTPVPAGVPGIPVAAGGGPGAAQEALAAQYRAAQAGTALAVLARETVQAAAAAAVFTMTLRRAAGLSPVPPGGGGRGGGGGIPRLPGPGGGALVPAGPIPVRIKPLDVLPAGGGGAGVAAGAVTVGVAFAAVAASAAGVVSAFHTVEGLVGKALPSATATLSGSFDVLQAKIGRDFIPIIDAASAAVQAASRAYDMVPRWLRESLVTAGITPALRLLGIQPEARAIRTGLQGGATAGEEYALSLQSAGLENDQLQTELMRLQYEALQEWLGTSRSIAADVAALRAQGPNFV